MSHHFSRSLLLTTIIALLLAGLFFITSKYILPHWDFLAGAPESTPIPEPTYNLELLPITDIPILWTATLSGQLLETENSEVLSTAATSSPATSAAISIASPNSVSSSLIFPATENSQALARQLSAPTALAIDLESQTPLFSYREHELYYPASSLKMMTALVARQLFPPDQVITLTSRDLTSSNSLGLKAGEQITVADLLQALLISSSNEAAQALANHSPLGYDDFVQQMNNLAEKLNLTDTTFVTPEGFDAPDQKTSVHDLALLAQAMLQDPYLKTIVALPTTTISTLDGTMHTLNSTNQFLKTPPQITRTTYVPDSSSAAPTVTTTSQEILTPRFYGVKTGTTGLAGQVLISAVEIDSRQLLLIVMSSQNRYQDTKTMLEWIMNNYYWLPYSVD